MPNILVIGATGQVGRVVVDEALRQGFTVRAQTRAAARARRSLPGDAEVVQASPVSADELRPLVTDVDGVVLTHGGDSDGERNFYAVIPALLDALGDRGAHISLMTTMNASHAASSGSYEFVAWKRRAEMLVRASGRNYTIVRPGWFDYQGPNEHRIDLRQGDRVTGQRGVDRMHIAQVLLGGMSVPSGSHRTVEVFSTAGEAITDFENLFAATQPDGPGALAGVLDATQSSLSKEPERVQSDIARYRAR